MLHSDLTVFRSSPEELGGNKTNTLPLHALSGELNGLGGAAGIQELRAPIGQVKNGEVRIFVFQNLMIKTSSQLILKLIGQISVSSLPELQIDWRLSMIDKEHLVCRRLC